MDFLVILKDDLLTELVPFDGDEGGDGTRFGSICSQFSLGNLDASDKTKKARRVSRKPFCHHEPDMLNEYIMKTA